MIKYAWSAAATSSCSGSVVSYPILSDRISNAPVSGMLVKLANDNFFRCIVFRFDCDHSTLKSILVPAIVYDNFCSIRVEIMFFFAISRQRAERLRRLVVS